MRVRFLHAADLHLDSPFRGLLDVHAELPAVLADATLKAFTRLVDLALTERVDFVALSGDLYDRDDRSLRARLHLQRETQRLHDADIRTFIVHGNHDPLAHDPGGLHFAPSVKVFSSQWEEICVPARQGGVSYRVQGVSFLEAVETKNLARAFSRQSDEPTIGLLHTNVGGDTTGHANYAPCTLDDLGAAQLDYWALGHVHTRAEYRLSPRGMAVYPGNLQGRHARELGPRGAVLVTIDPAGQGHHHVSTRFVPLDCVRWHFCDVSLQGLTTLDAVTETCLAHLRDRVSDDSEANLVRVRCSGRTALHGQLQAVDAISSLHESWQRELSAHRIWLESIENVTRPELDIERIRETDGLLQGLATYCLHGVPAAELDSLLDDEVLKTLDARLKSVGLSSLRETAPATAQDAAWRAIELVAQEDA
ncbi:MAG: DNA repair exonuclease [Myxococcaceae bacterium]|nr:DNA repair exonuclease [Myxococcaceae bacterium]